VNTSTEQINRLEQAKHGGLISDKDVEFFERVFLVDEDFLTTKGASHDRQTQTQTQTH
jgi:hypothetical protein